MKALRTPLTFWYTLRYAYLLSSKVPMSNTPKISVTFFTFTHPERVLILGGCNDDALYHGGPSSVPGRQVVSANNRGMEKMNRGRDLLEGSSTPGKGYLHDIYYISIITLKCIFDSAVRMHGCLSHDFAKAMQERRTRKTVRLNGF